MPFSSYFSTFWQTDGDLNHSQSDGNSIGNKLPPQSDGTVKTKVEHIEVIGGGSGQLPPLPPLGQQQAKPWRTAARSYPVYSDHGRHSSLDTSASFLAPNQSESDARLPTEIRNRILLLAAHQSHQSINHVLDLCTVDRSTHRTIFSFLILPQLTLHGLSQVKAFSKSLRMDGANVGLKEMVQRFVGELHIRRSEEEGTHTKGPDEENSSRKGFSSKATKIQATAASSHPSSSSPLYDSILNLSRFETSSLEDLRFIISQCKSLKRLSLGCRPLVLDPRWKGNDPDDTREVEESIGLVRGLISIRENLEELVCLQNLYGGDLNEELWKEGASVAVSSFNALSLSSNKWKHLKRIQLHGPRFRFTLQLARLLGNVVSLEEVGLIMPFIPKPSSSIDPDSIFQVLVDSCPKLKRLLIVGHDIKHFVGFIKSYSAALHALRRKWGTKCSCSNHQNGETRTDAGHIPDDLIQDLNIQLVTATIKGGDANGGLFENGTHCHPTVFSDWMLERTSRNLHWDFGDSNSEQSSSPCSSYREEAVSHSLESWTVPFETLYPSGDESDDSESCEPDSSLSLCNYCKREEKSRKRKEQEELEKQMRVAERDQAWNQRLRLAAIENRRRASRGTEGESNEEQEGVMGIDNLAS